MSQLLSDYAHMSRQYLLNMHVTVCLRWRCTAPLNTMDGMQGNVTERSDDAGIDAAPGRPRVGASSAPRLLLQLEFRTYAMATVLLA